MTQHNTFRGLLFMVLAAVCFSIMSSLIGLASHIDAYKTSLYRFVIGMALLSSAALMGKIRLDFNNRSFLFFRGLLGGIAVYLFFLSVRKLGVARGSIINYAYPIFAAIGSAIFLKERNSPLKWAAILASFAGIYLIASRGPLTSFSLGTYEMLAILGAVLGGSAIVFIRALHKTDSSYTIFYSQCLAGTWLMLIPANLVPCSIGYRGGLLLLGIGVSSAVGQLFFTSALRHVNVATGTVMSLLTPVMNLIIGIALFHEAFSTQSLIGALIVLTCCAVVALDRSGRPSVGKR